MQIRELLNVQLESTEEGILKRGLWQLMNNRIFFQHPDLMRLLRVHEDVMTIMMNVLTRQQSAVEAAESGGGDLPGQTVGVLNCFIYYRYYKVSTNESLINSLFRMHLKWL